MIYSPIIEWVCKIVDAIVNFLKAAFSDWRKTIAFAIGTILAILGLIGVYYMEQYLKTEYGKVAPFVGDFVVIVFCYALWKLLKRRSNNHNDANHANRHKQG